MKLGWLCGVLLLPLATACGSSDDEAGEGEPSDGCTRGELESDIRYVPMPLPGSPGPLAEPPAEGYVVSTTYLRLKHEEAAKSRFRTLNGPIQGDLLARSGLVALEFAIEAECNTARTKSVWTSTEAMYEFVTSEAHGAAVQSVGELSRGGSVVTHWTAKTLDETTWDEATARLKGDKGPIY
jgi:hypothetical protein